MNPARHSTAAALLVAALALSCSSAPDQFGGAAAPGSPDAVVVGDWGGPHAGLSAATAGATFEFDCGRGSISEPLQPDAQGHFDLPGVYVAAQAGPAAPIEENGQAARYTGQVNGASLTLTVTSAAAGEALGPFVLSRGATPRLVPCS